MVIRIILLISGFAIMLCSGAQQAQAACANPTLPEGQRVYNSDLNVMQYCDGISWAKIRL